MYVGPGGVLDAEDNEGIVAGVLVLVQQHVLVEGAGQAHDTAAPGVPLIAQHFVLLRPSGGGAVPHYLLGPANMEAISTHLSHFCNHFSSESSKELG